MIAQLMPLLHLHIIAGNYWKLIRLDMKHILIAPLHRRQKSSTPLCKFTCQNVIIEHSHRPGGGAIACGFRLPLRIRLSLCSCACMSCICMYVITFIINDNVYVYNTRVYTVNFINEHYNQVCQTLPVSCSRGEI